MADKLKVFTLDNLTLYDGLIKGYVDAADARSLKTVAIDGNTLKFYRVDEPVGETAPAYEITLPETDVSNFIEKVENATVDNLVTLNEDGTISDSGIAKEFVYETRELVNEINDETNGILATAKAYTDAEVKELADGAVKTNADAIAATQGEVDALEQVVTGMYTNEQIDTAVADAKKAGTDAQADVDALEGVVADMYTNKQIDDAIAAAQAAATYDDTQIKADIQANADAIEAHKTAVDGTVATLVGEDTGKSVRTIANEELAAQLLSGEADADFQTLQELAAWLENHPEDVATINLNISNLQKLVGTLPEGATSTDVVNYIAEVVAAEKVRAEGVESGLDTRLKAVETAVGEGGSVDTQIVNKIAELDADVTSADVEDGKGVQVQVVEVDGKVTAVNVTGNYDETYDVKGAAATALSDAKTYADGLNISMDTRVASLEAKVGEGFEAITSDEINALFA